MATQDGQKLTRAVSIEKNEMGPFNSSLRNLELHIWGNVHSINIYCVKCCPKQGWYCSKDNEVPIVTELISSGKADKNEYIYIYILDSDGTIMIIKVDKEKRLPEGIILLGVVREGFFKRWDLNRFK